MRPAVGAVLHMVVRGCLGFGPAGIALPRKELISEFVEKALHMVVLPRRTGLGAGRLGALGERQGPELGASAEARLGIGRESDRWVLRFDSCTDRRLHNIQRWRCSRYGLQVEDRSHTMRH